MPKRPWSEFEAVVDDRRFPGHDWMELYIRKYEEQNDDLRKSSKKAYVSIWRAYLIFLASRQRDAKRIDVQTVADFLSQHTESTRQRYGRLLNEVYSVALNVGAATINPFSSLTKILAAQECRPATAAVQVKDVRFFIRSLQEPEDWEEQRDQAAAVLALGAGLRLRELRELCVSQFDANDGRVQPRGRAVRSREIDLEPVVVSFLEDWLAVRRMLNLKVNNDLMFPSRTGSSIPINTFYRRIRKLLHTSFGDSLPHFGVGVLRAGFAQSFKLNDDVVTAQHALGHRRITSTIRFFRHLKPVDPS